MCRNNAFSTAYFKSWIKRCPGILEKVAMLLEGWVPFCLPSLFSDSKQSPSAFPLTSFPVGIYTDCTLQNQLCSDMPQQWLGPVATCLCYPFQRGRVQTDVFNSRRKLSVSFLCFPSLTAALAVFLIRLLLKKIQVQVELKDVHCKELFNILFLT